MTELIPNERTKLYANALDRASTALLTAGIIRPVAGYLYNVAGFGASIGVWRLAASVAGWILAWLPYIIWQDVSERIAVVIEASWFLAFVVTPALVVAIAWLGVILQERSNRRHPHPGE